MKFKQAILLCTCFIVVLTGCDSKKNTESEVSLEQTQAISEDEYAALLPYKSSDASTKHAQVQSNLNTNLTDTFAIGTGLKNLSKEHFSPSTYAYRENQFLTYDALDAYLSTGLLGRESEKNANGMNPKVGFEFSTDKGKQKITSKDVLLLDIYELDWYSSNELKGLSLALVLYDKIGDEPNQATISETDLKTYGEDISRKVVNYLRKTHPEIGSNMPIYVTLYNTSSTDKSLPGSYFREAMFESKTTASFRDIKDEWALFPTAAGSNLDSTTSAQFTTFKNSLKQFFPDDISVIGKAHFIDKQLKTLKIEVVLHAKTSAEVDAAIQYINSNLSTFTSKSYEIKVDISCDDVHVAAIERLKNTGKTTVIKLI